MANDGPTPLERFIQGIIPENPIYRQLLGLCPTLAVTAGMASAMTMAAAVTFVLVCANIIISAIRPLLKPHLRILVFTLTIATFVTIADRVLAAYMYRMSTVLGPYIPLIIVNCVIICRCEVCASKQSIPTAVSDALGQSLGFALGLASIASVREILGSGTWFGMRVMYWVCGFFERILGGFGFEGTLEWPNWGVMLQPPGAFLTLGLLLGLANVIGRVASRRQTKAPAPQQ